MDPSQENRFAYKPAHKPLVGDWIVPERWSLYVFRYFWSHIRVAVILIILTLALYEILGPLWTLVIDAFYLFWNHVASRNQFQARRTRLVNFIRHIVPIVGVFVLMAWLNGQAELLWLLFFVPMLTVGVELDRYTAIGVIAIDALAVFVTSFFVFHLSTQPWSVSPGGDGAVYGFIKAIIVSYIGLTSYFLSRSFAFVNQLNQRLLNLLPSIVSEPYGWEDAAQEAVLQVAKSFSDWRDRMTVNLLTLYGERLYFTASSSPQGQTLVKQDFSFPFELGITGSVAKTGQAMIISDVGNDPDRLYFSHAAFPATMAELAVPIKVSNQVVAVLDIEANRKNAFGNEDRQAMEFISAHLSEIYKQTHLLGRYKKLAELSTKLASTVIGVRDLGMLFKEIGLMAMEVLDAQLIGYYYKDPQNDGIKGPYTSGAVLSPEYTEPKYTSNPLILKLFSGAEIRTFPDAQKEADLLGTVSSSGLDQPFVIREGIVSCAAVPLAARGETIGLMFVNYRRPEKFSRELLDTIEIIAPLAALGIQNSIQEEISAITRKQRLLDELHDTVSHKLLAAKVSLEKLEKIAPDSREWKDQFASAVKYILSANRIVYKICHGIEVYTIRYSALQSILDELNNDADLIRNVFGIQVLVDTLAIPDGYKLQMVSVEAQHLIDEALYNAARHSRARMIEVRLGIEENTFFIHICDDGIGFDEKTIKPGTGLYSMRSKVQHILNGSMRLEARLGQGTRIEMQIPLVNLELEDH